MAIYTMKRGFDAAGAQALARAPAVAPAADTHAAMPAFSFGPNEGLAAMIVQAWSDEGFRDKLLDRNGSIPTNVAVQVATSSINSLGFNLKRAVVISEKEHDADYRTQHEDEVVFVLPDAARIAAPFGSRESLLQTARLLMACTPNGI